MYCYDDIVTEITGTYPSDKLSLLFTPLTSIPRAYKLLFFYWSISKCRGLSGF